MQAEPNAKAASREGHPQLQLDQNKSRRCLIRVCVIIVPKGGGRNMLVQANVVLHSIACAERAASSRHVHNNRCHFSEQQQASYDARRLVSRGTVFLSAFYPKHQNLHIYVNFHLSFHSLIFRHKKCVPYSRFHA